MCSFVLRKCLHADLRYCGVTVILFALVTFCYFLFLVKLESSGNDVQGTLEQADATSNEPSLLLVLIHSRGTGVEVRDAIRNTWVSHTLLNKLDKDLQDKIHYRFVLGVENISSALLTNLTAEDHIHKDMIMLDDVSDRHESLTYRTLRSFQYVSSRMSNFLYILKCDDDSIVNLLVVGKELSKRTANKRYFWGQFMGGSGIQTEGPYAEHRWSMCETYFPYALGGGYILSMDLVQLVTWSAPYLMVYNNEDVSLGAWLGPYNIERMADARFNTGSITRGCKKPYIVIHKVSLEQIHSYFDELMEEGYFCTKKNYKFVMFGYLYNWKAQPSKCCYHRRHVP